MSTLTTAAWSDAAALMVAATTDREALKTVVGAMVDAGRLADLATTLVAALELGGTLIEQECAREGQAGPVLSYLVAVSQHASELRE